MTKNIKVVIGANFGDEGKGLMTDYFASQDVNSIVVRSNGGAQAAHTVVTPENVEHVFSHFGSATMNGIPTYLSEYFIVNPILFKHEYEQLLHKMAVSSLAPTYIDETAVLTTPYDMMVNQIVEMSRGDNRHGSCGYGINETVRRSEDFDRNFKITVLDLNDPLLLAQKLIMIKNEYVPGRLLKLGITDVPEPFKVPLVDNGIIEAFLSDCADFVEKTIQCSAKILNNYNTVVFEGAQGLLLDQNSEFFPHVTHSNTGMENVSEILAKLDGDMTVEIAYITRSYMTRHGAGPLPHEVKELPYSRIVDPTNVPNQWQGALRFGILDIDFLKNHIFLDIKRHVKSEAKYSLVVTCLDQVDEYVKLIKDGKYNEEGINDFRKTLRNTFGTDWKMYESWGRTRETIKVN